MTDMDWSKNEKWKDLRPEVKSKAKELYHDLMEKEGLEKEEAREKAIKRATRWFYDLGG